MNRETFETFCEGFDAYNHGRPLPLYASDEWNFGWRLARARNVIAKHRARGEIVTLKSFKKSK
jgi:hypothetical protein